MTQDSGRNMAFDDTNKIQMSIPERIVLSAGYDGDDNQTPTSTSSTTTTSMSFDETPLVNPDFAMAGMPTPPSVLTIDHDVKATTNNFASSSPLWHTEGDGAVQDENETLLHKYTRLRGGGGDQTVSRDDFDGVNINNRLSRSVEIVGRESNISDDSFVLADDASTVHSLFTNIQRRLTGVEKGLEYQNRVSNVCRFSLFTIAFLYPLVLHYLFAARRR